MRYVWKYIQVIFNVWCDVGKALGEYYSDPSTESDVLPGQEILLHFTLCNCLTILHTSKQYEKQKIFSALLDGPYRQFL